MLSRVGHVREVRQVRQEGAKGVKTYKALRDTWGIQAIGNVNHGGP